MSYNLVPRNKELKSFHFNAVAWPWLLEAGVGLVIGTGRAMCPGCYSYQKDKQGLDPNHCDGFYVTADQARAMAMAARGLFSVQTHINREWEALTKEERENRKRINGLTVSGTYKTPVRNDFVGLAGLFAKWADKSNGFWVK